MTERGRLRAGVDRATANHVLYQLTSLDCFDLLCAGRALSPRVVADLPITQAEPMLLQD